MGSSDQSRREAGVARKELTENSRVAVPVIYRCITNLSKLSEAKRQPFYMFREAVGQKFRQGTAGALVSASAGKTCWRKA